LYNEVNVLIALKAMELGFKFLKFKALKDKTVTRWATMTHADDKFKYYEVDLDASAAIYFSGQMLWPRLRRTSTVSMSSCSGTSSPAKIRISYESFGIGVAVTVVISHAPQRLGSQNTHRLTRPLLCIAR
jgi:hypothetical protein